MADDLTFAHEMVVTLTPRHEGGSVRWLVVGPYRELDGRAAEQKSFSLFLDTEQEAKDHAKQLLISRPGCRLRLDVHPNL